MDSEPDLDPVSVSIPVAWGEMDAFQHVNNVMYARWVETARIEYLVRVGLMERMRDEGVGPILARLSIDYRRPVTFPDTVRVGVRTTRIGGSSFTMGFRIWSEAQQAEVATGEQVLVIFDYRQARTAPIDDRLRAAIAAVEGAGAGA
jgi:acyl-CoA thioester hydrolase